MFYIAGKSNNRIHPSAIALSEESANEQAQIWPRVRAGLDKAMVEALEAKKRREELPTPNRWSD